MEVKAVSDPDFGEALAAAHDSYARERSSLLEVGTVPVPTGGVGGTARGVKCLHAHYAHRRAGGENPVGALVEEWITPLDCTVPCVVDGAFNPDWSNRP